MVYGMDYVKGYWPETVDVPPDVMEVMKGLLKNKSRWDNSKIKSSKWLRDTEWSSYLKNDVMSPL